jgi:hypothetical protein
MRTSRSLALSLLFLPALLSAQSVDDKVFLLPQACRSNGVAAADEAGHAACRRQGQAQG